MILHKRFIIKHVLKGCDFNLKVNIFRFICSDLKFKHFTLKLLSQPKNILLFYNLFYVHLKNYFKVKVTTIVYYLNHEMYHTLTLCTYLLGSSLVTSF